MKLKHFKMKLEKAEKYWYVDGGEFPQYFDKKEDAIAYMGMAQEFTKIYEDKYK